ncbi:MAG TPA: cupin domain-containing protein [Candidatus Eisenbacteria bacterium]|nr:cupin domain-containing protein [Candidatus Eisenbacteria bacterium]
MIKPIRRIVTGHNAQGRSIIVSDAPSPHVLTLPGRADLALTDLWVTDRAPASNAGSADAAKRRMSLEPPMNGSIFRVVEFQPDAAGGGGFDRAAAFRAMGATHALDPDGSRHPAMHRTDTVDYALVLTGEIWALMDEGETLMRAGDTLVQRGTNHAWSNRSDQPSLVAFVLVSATPLGGKGAAAKPVKRAAARAGRGSPSRRPSRRTTARPRRKPRPR